MLTLLMSYGISHRAPFSERIGHRDGELFPLSAIKRSIDSAISRRGTSATSTSTSTGTPVARSVSERGDGISYLLHTRQATPPGAPVAVAEPIATQQWDTKSRCRHKERAVRPEGCQVLPLSYVGETPHQNGTPHPHTKRQAQQVAYLPNTPFTLPSAAAISRASTTSLQRDTIRRRTVEMEMEMGGMIPGSRPSE